MKNDCIYPQLMIQMYLVNLNSRDLAKKTDISYTTLRRKLRGKTKLNLDEATKIKKAIDSDVPLERLFEIRSV